MYGVTDELFTTTREAEKLRADNCELRMALFGALVTLESARVWNALDGRQKNHVRLARALLREMADREREEC